jgi:hypothetical protein
MPGTVSITYNNNVLDIMANGDVFPTVYQVDLSSPVKRAWGWVVGSEEDVNYAQPIVETVVGISKETWKKIPNGFRFSRPWYTKEFYLETGYVSDSDDEISIENYGEYVRCVFRNDLKGFAIRVYRTPTKYLIIDEIQGGYILLNINGNQITWKQTRNGIYPGGLASMRDYSFTVSKN